jgi:hypothetical protein
LGVKERDEHKTRNIHFDNVNQVLKIVFFSRNTFANISICARACSRARVTLSLESFEDILYCIMQIQQSDISSGVVE